MIPKGQQLPAHQPGSARPSAHAGTAVPPRTRRSLFYHRLAVLAVVLYNPPILLAYLLYTYGPSNVCVAGQLCYFGSFPGIIQVLLLLFSSFLLWLMLYVLTRRTLEESNPTPSRMIRWLRALSEIRSIRPLLAIYGASLALALIGAWSTGRLTPAVFVVGALGAFVCLWGARDTGTS